MMLGVAPAVFVPLDAAQCAFAKCHLTSTFAQLREAFSTPLLTYTLWIDPIEQLNTQVAGTHARLGKRQRVERAKPEIVSLTVALVAQCPPPRELPVDFPRHLHQQIPPLSQHHAL